MQWDHFLPIYKNMYVLKGWRIQQSGCLLWFVCSGDNGESGMYENGKYGIKGPGGRFCTSPLQLSCLEQRPPQGLGSCRPWFFVDWLTFLVMADSAALSPYNMPPILSWPFELNLWKWILCEFGWGSEPRHCRVAHDHLRLSSTIMLIWRLGFSRSVPF